MLQLSEKDALDVCLTKTAVNALRRLEEGNTAFIGQHSHKRIDAEPEGPRGPLFNNREKFSLLTSGLNPR